MYTDKAKMWQQKAIQVQVIIQFNSIQFMFINNNNNNNNDNNTAKLTRSVAVQWKQNLVIVQRWRNVPLITTLSRSRSRSSKMGHLATLLTVNMETKLAGSRELELQMQTVSRKSKLRKEETRIRTRNYETRRDLKLNIRSKQASPLHAVLSAEFSSVN
jgi:hypothetical protein